MMRSKSVKYVCLIGALSTLAACNPIYSSELVISNETNDVLRDVVVDFAGRTIEIGDIEINGVRTERSYFHGEGELSFVFTRQGLRQKGGLSYITHGSGAFCGVTVESDLVQYRCSTREGGAGDWYPLELEQAVGG